MKNYYLFFMLPAMLLISACSNDDKKNLTIDDTNNAALLVGKWATYSYDYYKELRSRVTIRQFNSDGTGKVFGEYGDTTEFTYEILYDTVLACFLSNSYYNWNHTFKVVNDTLFYTTSSGNKPAIYLRETGSEARYTLTFLSGNSLGSYTEAGLFHGAKFELPKPEWLPNNSITVSAGKMFMGWFGNDNKTYRYDDEIYLKSNMTFTAEIADTVSANYPKGIDNSFTGAWYYFKSYTSSQGYTIAGRPPVEPVIDTISLITVYHADGTGMEYYLCTEMKQRYSEPFVWSAENGNVVMNFSEDFGTSEYRYYISDNFLIQKTRYDTWNLNRYHGEIPKYFTVND